MSTCSCVHKLRGLGLRSQYELNLQTRHGRLTWVKGITEVPLLHQFCSDSRPKQTAIDTYSTLLWGLKFRLCPAASLRGSTLSASSVTSVCWSVAAGSVKGGNHQSSCNKCDRAVHKRAHTSAHRHAATQQSSHSAVRERWHIIKPLRWCTEPHRHLQLVLFEFLLCEPLSAGGPVHAIHSIC